MSGRVDWYASLQRRRKEAPPTYLDVVQKVGFSMTDDRQRPKVSIPSLLMGPAAGIAFAHV